MSENTSIQDTSIKQPEELSTSGTIDESPTEDGKRRVTFQDIKNAHNVENIVENAHRQADCIASYTKNLAKNLTEKIKEDIDNIIHTLPLLVDQTEASVAGASSGSITSTGFVPERKAAKGMHEKAKKQAHEYIQHVNTIANECLVRSAENTNKEIQSKIQNVIKYSQETGQMVTKIYVDDVKTAADNYTEQIKITGGNCDVDLEKIAYDTQNWAEEESAVIGSDSASAASSYVIQTANISIKFLDQINNIPFPTPDDLKTKVKAIFSSIKTVPYSKLSGAEDRATVQIIAMANNIAIKTQQQAISTDEQIKSQSKSVLELYCTQADNFVQSFSLQVQNVTARYSQQIVQVAATQVQKHVLVTAVSSQDIAQSATTECIRQAQEVSVHGMEKIERSSKETTDKLKQEPDVSEKSIGEETAEENPSVNTSLLPGDESMNSTDSAPFASEQYLLDSHNATKQFVDLVTAQATQYVDQVRNIAQRYVHQLTESETQRSLIIEDDTAKTPTTVEQDAEYAEALRRCSVLLEEMANELVMEVQASAQVLATEYVAEVNKTAVQYFQHAFLSAIETARRQTDLMSRNVQYRTQGASLKFLTSSQQASDKYLELLTEAADQYVISVRNVAIDAQILGVEMSSEVNSQANSSTIEYATRVKEASEIYLNKAALEVSTRVTAMEASNNENKYLNNVMLLTAIAVEKEAQVISGKVQDQTQNIAAVYVQNAHYVATQYFQKTQSMAALNLQTVAQNSTAEIYKCTLDLVNKVHDVTQNICTKVWEIIKFEATKI